MTTEGLEVVEIEGWNATAVNEAVTFFNRMAPGEGWRLLRTLAPFFEPSFRMKGGARVMRSAVDRELALFWPVRFEVWDDLTLRVREPKLIQIQPLGLMLAEQLGFEQKLLRPRMGSALTFGLWEILSVNFPALWHACSRQINFWPGFRWLAGKQLNEVELGQMLQALIIEMSQPEAWRPEVSLQQMLSAMIWFNLWSTVVSFCLMAHQGRNEIDLLPLLERFQSGSVPLGMDRNAIHTFVYFAL